MKSDRIYAYLSKTAIIFFVVIELVIQLAAPVIPAGEWDDYLFCTASIIHDHDMAISDDDIAYARIILFPEVSTWGDFSGSCIQTKSGETLPWYFGTYSAACIPMVYLLQLLNVQPIRAFLLTNILVYALALIFVYQKMRISPKAKFLLILLLILNPAIYYISWLSSEVFLFSLVVAFMVSWTNRWYKTTALLVSVAASLNPTVLAIGLPITIDYFCFLKKTDQLTGCAWPVKVVQNRFWKLAGYLACYLPSFIVFGYNYYYSGGINLTASSPNFTDTQLALPRFLAYLFDLNFGILPYMGIVLALSLLFLIPAIIKKAYRFVWMMMGFFIIILGYSFMKHINCGMSGMSRYNVWSAPIMIFSVLANYEDMLGKRFWMRAIEVLLCVSIALTGTVLYKYGLRNCDNAYYVYMTPIAAYVLDHFPSLYNPLHSTFNSRTSHVDGGYDYELPLYYANHEGEIRKILADGEFAEEVLSSVTGSETSMEYLVGKLDTLGDRADYVSISPKYNLYMTSDFNEYALGSAIWFCGEDRNVDTYVSSGVTINEATCSWADSKSILMKLHITDAPACANDTMSFTVANVYNRPQRVVVMSNGEEIWNQTITEPGTYQFVIPDVQNGYVHLEFDFPDAVSPISLGGSYDSRMLSLAFVNAEITAAE